MWLTWSSLPPATQAVIAGALERRDEPDRIAREYIDHVLSRLRR